MKNIQSCQIFNNCTRFTSTIFEKPPSAHFEINLNDLVTRISIILYLATLLSSLFNNEDQKIFK